MQKYRGFATDVLSFHAACKLVCAQTDAEHLRFVTHARTAVCGVAIKQRGARKQPWLTSACKATRNATSVSVKG